MPTVETCLVTGTVDNFNPSDLPVVLFEGDKDRCLDFFDREIQRLIKEGYRTRRSKTDKTRAFVLKGQELCAILDLKPDECKHPSEVTQDWVAKKMAHSGLSISSIASNLGLHWGSVWRHLHGDTISPPTKAAYFYFFKEINK